MIYKLKPEQERVFWSMVANELSRQLSLPQDASDWGENERNTINEAINQKIKAAYENNRKVAGLCNLEEKQILQGKIDVKSFVRSVLIDQKINTTRDYNKHRFSYLLMGKPANDFIEEKHVLQYASNIKEQHRIQVESPLIHFINERKYKANRLVNKLNKYKDEQEAQDFLTQFQNLHEELVYHGGIDGSFSLVVEIYMDIYDLAKVKYLSDDGKEHSGKSIFDAFGGRGFYLRDSSVISRIKEYLGLNEDVEKYIESFKRLEEKTDHDYLAFYEKVLLGKAI